MKKFNFNFKLTDGSSYIIKDVPEGFDKAIWDNIDEYCSMFENETKKVRSVIQEEVKWW